MSRSFSYYIPHIMCVGCSDPIHEALSKNILFTNVLINPTTKKLTIITPDTVNEENVELILRNYFKSRSQRCVTWKHKKDIGYVPPPSKFSVFFSDRRLGVFGIVIGCLLMITMLIFPPISLGIMLGIGVVSTLLTGILGYPFYKKAFQALREKRLTMDTLFGIGSLVVLAVSWCAFFLPGFCFMFEAALLIFGFRYLGLEIRKSLNQASDSKQLFTDRLNKQVEVIENERWITKSLSEIAVHDIIRLPADAWVPLDGVVESKSGACINTQSLNGRGWDNRAPFGTILKAGSQIKNADVHLRVTETWKDDHPFLKADNKIEIASQLKMGYIEKSARWLQYFIPMILIIAILAGILIGTFFSFGMGLLIASFIVVSACPCTLALVVPAAVEIGVQKAAAESVIIKNAAVLEAAGDVDCVVFDLNGTLTQGIPKVLSHKLLLGDDENDMLDCLVSLESQSHHGVAEAIRSYVNLCGASVKPKFIMLDEEGSQPHNGVCGKWKEHNVLVGDINCMRAAGVAVRESKITKDLRTVYLAREGKLWGQLVWRDPLRPDAKSTIEALQLQGKRICIATGENAEVARRYAEILGINPQDVYAGLQNGAAKADIIKDIQRGGNAAVMVGDGGNDSAAMQEARVGIFMPSAKFDPKTKEDADIELMNGRLSSIVSIFEIVGQTVSHIKQNLILSIGYNVSIMLVTSILLLTIGFMLNPGIGALLMIVQMGLVFANTYRIKNKSPLTPREEIVPESFTQMHSFIRREPELSEVQEPLSQPSNESINSHSPVFHSLPRSQTPTAVGFVL